MSKAKTPEAEAPLTVTQTVPADVYAWAREHGVTPLGMLYACMRLHAKLSEKNGAAATDAALQAMSRKPD